MKCTDENNMPVKALWEFPNEWVRLHTDSEIKCSEDMKLSDFISCFLCTQETLLSTGILAFKSLGGSQL